MEWTREGRGVWAAAGVWERQESERVQEPGMVMESGTGRRQLNRRLGWSRGLGY